MLWRPYLTRSPPAGKFKLGHYPAPSVVRLFGCAVRPGGVLCPGTRERFS
jgi:hypothetical protein